MFSVHARQFHALRQRCCPSEAAYLSSIRRCRKWDAQGGKRKAFFAKTLDDRFIIKQQAVLLFSVELKVKERRSGQKSYLVIRRNLIRLNDQS